MRPIFLILIIVIVIAAFYSNEEEIDFRFKQKIVRTTSFEINTPIQISKVRDFLGNVVKEINVLINETTNTK